MALKAKGRAGTERENAPLVNVARVLGPLCTNCSGRPVVAKGLCDACYQYRRIHGADRPEELVVAQARRAAEAGQVFTVYRLYSDRLDLLYVGCSNMWPRRLAGHATRLPWWAEVAVIRLEHHATRKAAEYAEAQAIETEHPVYNVAGTKDPAPSRAKGRAGWTGLAKELGLAVGDGP